MRLYRYLSELSPSRTILWCYLLWYIYTACRYFDPNLQLWLTSLGISFIIGIGLYLSTAHGGSTPTQLGRWQVARLFLMPFCVSSFAALIKDRGFVLIFHPSLSDNLQSSGLVVAFVALTQLSRLTLQRRRTSPPGIPHPTPQPDS